MENNQEHEIDKIFKKSLENQFVTPPADAWMGIHTYTIGQEKTERKIGLKYASLGVLVLLVLGFGLWYYFSLNSDYETSHRADLRISGLKTQSKIQKSINTVDSKSDDVESKISTLTLNKKIHKSINRHGATFRNPNSDNIFSHEPKLLSHEVYWSGEQPRDGENAVRVFNPDSIEKFIYSNDNLVPSKSEKQIESIESKPLISNDLSKKMNEQLLEKIDDNYLEEKAIQKDSVAEEIGGKRFSLKHPIISFGFGMLWNFWDVQRQVPLSGLVELPNRSSRGATLKFGIAWKINKKLRVGMSVGINGLDAGIPSTSIPLPVTSASAGNQPIIKLISVNSNQFYRAETPYGNVNLPISIFKDIPTFKPNELDEQKQVYYTNSHQMSTVQLSINSQYDLLFKNRKQYSYQLYGLLDYNIQRQIIYNYTATTQYLVWVEKQWEQKFLDIYSDESHLQNASELVFGLRAGLGFRYQFAKKWDFYVEGSGQHSFNNWVKSDDIKTFQKSLSLQAGINLNL
jgi:hypothetical protein